MSIKVLLLLYRNSRVVLFCFWTLWSCFDAAVPPSVPPFFHGEKTISLDRFSVGEHDHPMRANGFRSAPWVWVAFPHCFLFQAPDFLQFQPTAALPHLAAQASGAGALTPGALPGLGGSPPKVYGAKPIAGCSVCPCDRQDLCPHVSACESVLSVSFSAVCQEGCQLELQVTSGSGLACEKMAEHFSVWAGPLK